MLLPQRAEIASYFGTCVQIGKQIRGKPSQLEVVVRNITVPTTGGGRNVNPKNHQKTAEIAMFYWVFPVNEQYQSDTVFADAETICFPQSTTNVAKIC